MKYQKIKKIERFKKEDGWWIKVIFENNTEWVPSLLQLAIILNEIGLCEDTKYLNGEGRQYTRRFINDILKDHKTVEEMKSILYNRFDPNQKIDGSET